eukprot:GEMP01013782.1.p1 GENE.GEMP01013782.1~~GEMP01013782.1.p1  ORF type:complete len:730 (+),score=183.06 GEMP01013782.1:230-2419(+)
MMIRQLGGLFRELYDGVTTEGYIGDFDDATFEKTRALPKDAKDKRKQTRTLPHHTSSILRAHPSIVSSLRPDLRNIHHESPLPIFTPVQQTRTDFLDKWWSPMPSPQNDLTAKVDTADGVNEGHKARRRGIGSEGHSNDPTVEVDTVDSVNEGRAERNLDIGIEGHSNAVRSSVVRRISSTHPIGGANHTETSSHAPAHTPDCPSFVEFIPREAKNDTSAVAVSPNRQDDHAAEAADPRSSPMAPGAGFKYDNQQEEDDVVVKVLDESTANRRPLFQIEGIARQATRAISEITARQHTALSGNITRLSTSPRLSIMDFSVMRLSSAQQPQGMQSSDPLRAARAPVENMNEKCGGLPRRFSSDSRSSYCGVNGTFTSIPGVAQFPALQRGGDSVRTQSRPTGWGNPNVLRSVSVASPVVRQMPQPEAGSSGGPLAHRMVSSPIKLQQLSEFRPSDRSVQGSAHSTTADQCITTISTLADAAITSARFALVSATDRVLSIHGPISALRDNLHNSSWNTQCNAVQRPRGRDSPQLAQTEINRVTRFVSETFHKPPGGSRLMMMPPTQPSLSHTCFPHVTNNNRVHRGDEHVGDESARADRNPAAPSTAHAQARATVLPPPIVYNNDGTRHANGTGHATPRWSSGAMQVPAQLHGGKGIGWEIQGMPLLGVARRTSILLPRQTLIGADMTRRTTFGPHARELEGAADRKTRKPAACLKELKRDQTLLFCPRPT